MAMIDWNHNDKKDKGDDFMEYNIIHNSKGEQENGGPSSSDERKGKAIAVIAMILGGVGASMLEDCCYLLIHIDPDCVPAFIDFPLWFLLWILLAFLILYLIVFLISKWK